MTTDRKRLLAALLLLVGCASTKVESTWTNPNLPARKIKSFAVFASTGYPSGRIEFEQQLTDALRKRGLDAIPGYQFVEYDEYPGKQEILRRVQAKGVQGALISRRSRALPGRTSTPWWSAGRSRPAGTRRASTSTGPRR